jgi:nucleoside 2-deoxyribosyltransferase
MTKETFPVGFSNLTWTQLQRFKRQSGFSLYLCGPIKDQSEEKIHFWRNHITRLLAPYSITIYDPSRRDYREILQTTPFEDLHFIDEEIVTIDTEEITRSDALICNLHEVSAGSSMELRLAWMLHKFVITLVPSIRNTSPWVRHHSTVMVETIVGSDFINRTIDHLKKVFPATFERGRE